MQTLNPALSLLLRCFSRKSPWRLYKSFNCTAADQLGTTVAKTRASREELPVAPTPLEASDVCLPPASSDDIWGEVSVGEMINHNTVFTKRLIKK